MKTTFAYDRYYDYEEMSACLKQLAKAYPALMKLESICTSEEGKEVWAITLSDSAKQPAEQKPAFYMDGNHHAGEVTGSMACLHFIDVILTNHADGKIAKLLQDNTVYVIPKISPDGSDVYLHTADKLRSVNRLYPKDTIGAGLHAKDMNADGVIAMMRVPSAYGAWKKSDTDPFIMTKRQPDETEGTFYQIYPEGEVMDYDGVHVAIGTEKWGLDFNRNYPFGWFAEARQPGAGKYPLSNPENKAVADFVIAHPNIVTGLTMHTTGGVLVYPPGTMPSKQADAQDMRMYQEIGAMATREMGYPVVNIFDAFLQDTDQYSSGAFDDWCYHTQGIPTYTVELWNVKERAGCPSQWPVQRDKSDAEKEEEFVKVVNWVKENVPEGILHWQTYQHPQLGEVEIGGLDFKFTCQNCPPAFLKQEMEKTTAFALRHAQVLPRLVWDWVQTKAYGEGIYQVEAVLGNHGYLPTYVCNEAKRIQVIEPLQVQLQGAEILSKQGEITELSGFFNVHTQYSYDGITTGNYAPCAQKISWLIKGKAQDTIKLSAGSPKAGYAEINVVLQ